VNIERYLLRKVLFVRNVHDLSDLFKDIEEALEKPDAPKRDPLSKDEIVKISIKCAKIKRDEDLTEGVIEESEWEDLIYFVRAIERAHGIGVDNE
jgi:hypothetical protein